GPSPPPTSVSSTARRTTAEGAAPFQPDESEVAMPFQPVLEPQPLLLVPPLLPPLVLRTENGFFGAPPASSPASATARPAPASGSRPFHHRTRRSPTTRAGRSASSRPGCTRRWTWRARPATACSPPTPDGWSKSRSAAAGPVATSASTITRSGTAGCRGAYTLGGAGRG